MTQRVHLKNIDNPWAAVGLTVLAVESGLCAIAFNMTDDAKIVALSTFGALIGLSLVTVYAIERLRSTALAVTSHRLVCRTIPSRRDLYLEISRLIHSSQSIRDTTWGKRARDLTRSEEFLRESAALEKMYPNYQCAVLPADLSKLSIPDIIIGDDVKLILSHVSVDDPPRHKSGSGYIVADWSARLVAMMSFHYHLGST